MVQGRHDLYLGPKRVELVGAGAALLQGLHSIPIEIEIGIGIEIWIVIDID